MLYEKKSRYYGVETYSVMDRRGREVVVVGVPAKRRQVFLGIHLMRQGQRLDHLAAKYLDDPAGYWRIAEFSDAMLPEALTDDLEVSIPRKTR